VKIIGGHAGGYLPFLLPRLDQGFRSFDSVRETIQTLPSDYAERIYVDSIAYSAETLDLTLRTFGTANLLFGSDYPHKCGDMAQMLGFLDDVPPLARAAVRGGNAERVFSL
jgi:aminocarboxymuconate-semialdehyde decarboxylase